MIDDFTITGDTVKDAKVKKFVDLVTTGVPAKDAAAEVVFPLSSFRKEGVLARATRELLQRVAEEKLLDKKTEEQLARSRRIELMMQDEDLPVAMRAVASTLKTDAATLALQVNNNLILDPEVIASLKALGVSIEVEAEESDETDAAATV